MCRRRTRETRVKAWSGWSSMAPPETMLSSNRLLTPQRMVHPETSISSSECRCRSVVVNGDAVRRERQCQHKRAILGRRWFRWRAWRGSPLEPPSSISCLAESGFVGVYQRRWFSVIGGRPRSSVRPKTKECWRRVKSHILLINYMAWQNLRKSIEKIERKL